MLSFLRLSLLWLAVAAALSAHAETDRATAEMLVRKSGMWEQLGTVASQFRVAVRSVGAKTGAKLSSSQLADMLRAVDLAYAPERMRSVTVAVIAERTDSRHVPELRRWFESPAGERISRLEEAASTDPRDPESAMKEDAAAIERIAAPRRALLDELVDAIGAAEFGLKLTTNSVLAVQRGVASVFPDDTGPSASELAAMFDAQRPRMLQALKRIAIGSFGRAYAPLSNAELAQYVAFLKSPAGTHFNEVTLRALDASFVDGGAELGRNLSRQPDRPRT